MHPVRNTNRQYRTLLPILIIFFVSQSIVFSKSARIVIDSLFCYFCISAFKRLYKTHSLKRQILNSRMASVSIELS